MTLLIGAVVLVGVVGLTDLLLTFGVIRRLREHTELLAPFRGGQDAEIGLPQGQKPEQFTAVTTAGLNVNGPAGLALVAIFSTTCSICPKRVPAFVDYVRAYAEEKDEVLAVVTGPDAPTAPYLPELAGVARVCVEPASGPIGRAFGVQGFPAFFTLDADGTILMSSYDPDALPTSAAARA